MNAGLLQLSVTSRIGSARPAHILERHQSFRNCGQPQLKYLLRGQGAKDTGTLLAFGNNVIKGLVHFYAAFIHHESSQGCLSWVGANTSIVKLEVKKCYTISQGKEGPFYPLMELFLSRDCLASPLVRSKGPLTGGLSLEMCNSLFYA